MINDKTSKLAVEFYEKLGSDGMASLTNAERDEAMLKFVLKFLKKSDSILDLACGYGRISFPLLSLRYNVSGIDISPNLINDAKKMAKEENVNVDFKVGDMRELPYSSESFDKVICLWSSFNHLLTEEDQLKAVNEIYRTLKNGGLAIIELPNGESKWAKKNIKLHGRIVPDEINSLKLNNYIHDRQTLREVCKKSNFKRYEVSFANIGGRRRIVVFCWK